MNPFSLLLRAQPTQLLGRADELETIYERLVVDEARLLTLTGPAGVGKTRLALAAAAQVADHFPDGVTLVDLTPVRDPLLVLPAIARALGLTDTGHPPLPERLRDFLRERTALLLVLDNVEQVLPAATYLAGLLASCPGLVLLVTSRVPLHLRWEQVLRVLPLPVPDLGTALPAPDALALVPSVALFVERAHAHRADFALTAAQAPLVAQLVVQLDGLPLALELAAARLDVLPLATIVRRLEDRLRLLRWEAPDLPERQQSLEAAVGWSYDLLDAGEQRLFRCLGAFVGRVCVDTLAAVVAAVAGAPGAAGNGDAAGKGSAEATLEGLVSLAEKSLILPPGRQCRHEESGTTVKEEEREDDQEPAFGMLETVREYARERLIQHGELAAAQRAHAHSFLALAERADPQLRGQDQLSWFLRLEREHDNLRAALRWLVDQDDPAEREAALRLAGALGWFWAVRGYHTEGRRWLEEALDRAPPDEGTAGDGTDEVDGTARTRALLFAGMLSALQGEVARARAMLEEALTLAERRRDPKGAAHALTQLGLRAILAGEAAEATRPLEEALGRWEALGDPYEVGVTLLHLGYAADVMGDVGAAAAHYTAALGRLAAAGDTRFAGFVHCFLGVAEWERGELPSAVEQVRAAVRTSVAQRDRCLLSLGAQVAVALVGARPEPATRARLLGATDALAQATGVTFVQERLPGGHDVAELRERLAQKEEEAAAYREGCALPFGAVVALALTLLEEVAQAQAQHAVAAESAQQPVPLSQPPNPLSAREQEVLRLVAQGRTNKAIGRQLFIAASTVDYHLSSVFHKLGVDTRAQAVAVAAQRGLV